MEIEKIFSDKLEKMAASGEIQQLVERKIKELLEESIDNAFRWDARKLCEKKVIDEISPVLSRLDFSVYAQAVQAAALAVQDSIINMTKEKTKQFLDSLFCPEKTRMKLSELMQEFVDYEIRYADAEDDYSVMRSDSQIKVFVGRKCVFFLNLFSDGRIFYIEYKGRKIERLNFAELSQDSFLAYLYSLSINRVVIEFDVDDEDILEMIEEEEGKIEI